MALAETAELAVRIGLKDNLSTGLDRMTRSVGRFDTGMGRATKGVGQIGKGIGKAGLRVGGIVALGLVAVAAAAIEVDDAFSGIKKTIDEQDLEAAGLSFDKLERSFRDMATEIPVSVVELARIGEAAGALGVEAGSIETFTKTVAQLAVTTDLSADTAATALGKIGTVLNLTGDDYTAFADTLVNLGNKGASTETEIIAITQRFAATGRQAGLATDEILALASATASLGVRPEAGGGALSRLFGNLGTNIALANKQGKAFAALTGIAIPKAQRLMNQGEGMTLFDEMLKSIKDLNKVDAAKALVALGVTNVRDRDVILKLAQNYDFLGEQMDTAKNSTGALSEEAQKRFTTIESSLRLLKNQFVEAALTIGGDGSDPKSFIGSIGVAANKLSEFLKKPGNKRDLEAFGARLGGIIAGIDFDKLFTSARKAADVLKPALDTVLLIVNALGKLPDNVKGLGVGLLALDKLSGGLVGQGAGNVVGGLAEQLSKGLASRIPMFGAAFVQRVFVVNQGIGGGGKGGIPPVASGIGAAGVAATVGATLGVIGISAAALYALYYGIPELVRGGREAGPNGEAGGFAGKLGSATSQSPTTAIFERQMGALLPPLQRIESNTADTATSVAKPADAPDVTDFRGQRPGGEPVRHDKTSAHFQKLSDRLAAVYKAEGKATRNGNESRARRLESKAERIRAKLGEEGRKSTAAQRATKDRLGALQERANNKLDLIRAKRTMFTVNNTIPVTTTVSIADLNARTISRARIAKTSKVSVWP